MSSARLDLHLDMVASELLLPQGLRERSVNGLWICKPTDDLLRYERAISVANPEVIVETGTRSGGSALWFAQYSDVITIDLEQRDRPCSDRVTWLVGNSVNPVVVVQVAKLVAGRRCLVSLDSDHHYPHVLTEIVTYMQFVSPGSYLVIEDGIFDLIGQRGTFGGARIPAVGGPLKAINHAMAGMPGWRRDTSLERLTDVTHMPAGWWVRTHGPGKGK